MYRKPERRPDAVGYVFSRAPSDGWEERARELAKDDERIMLVAKTDGEYGAFAILYTQKRQEADELAEQLFGTQVAYEGKVGTRGLKTR
jgi:hypothetical protein